MPCNEHDTDCSQRPTPPPDPVMPRCDVMLVDGTFNNTTVVVEDGCIIEVTSGRPPQYAPDPCCVAPGGGGGGGGGGNDEPCDCPPGADGENATINIGQVYSTAPGTTPKVVNTGSETNAVLDFFIPRGEQGASGETFTGVNDTRGGIVIENGVITVLPPTWPPVSTILTSATPAGNVAFNAGLPDPTSGIVEVTLDLSMFERDLKDWAEEAIEEATTPLQNQITSLQGQIQALQSQVSSLQTQVANCC